MRLYTIFAALLFYTFSLNAQAVLFEENFNNCTLPSDWTVNLVGNQDAIWYVSDEINNTNSDGSTIDGSCMLVFDDDATGNNTDDWYIELTTPAFDGTEFSTINFSTDVHFRQIEESFLRISVFNGTEFVELATWQGGTNTGEQFSEFVTFTADLSFYANPNMQLRYEFNDGQTWAWWAGIDNILVTGEGNATNIIANDFNNCVIPNGWSTVVLSGDDNWQFGTAPNGGNSMNGSCFAYFDDDIIGEEAAFSTVALVSPPFSGTDYADIFLDFDVILRRAVDNEHLGIYIYDGEESVNVVNYFADLGGPNFTEYIHERIDLSPFRQESMQVVFVYDDGDGWGWWAGVDNIKISGSGSLNDLCENAIDISLNQECLAGNNQNALFVGEQPACSPRNEGALWYRYTATATGIVEVVTNADFNDVITIYTGGCMSQSELICYDRDEQGFTGENLFFNANVGTEYLIRISGKNENFGVPRGNLCLELKAATNYPPSENNDACSSAIPLTIDANCVASNNVNADLDGDMPSLNVLSRADVWYSFTAGDEPIEIKSNADFADVITVFSGTCTNMSEVASNDAGHKLRLDDLTSGENYLIQISGFFSTIEGNLCAQVTTVNDEAPDNDECFTALPLTIGTACHVGNNIGASQSTPRPSCETDYDASVWFEFIAPESGAVNMNTGADFVHSVSIYAGACNDLEEVYCINNPLTCGGYFKVGSLNAGDTYFLQIASASNHLGFLETGNFCIEIIDGNQMTAPALDLNVGVECTGQGTGQLSVAAVGGSGIYTFQGNTDGEILATGDNYLVIVTDDSGCEVSVSGTANCGVSDCVLTTEITGTNISCNGANNGTASVSANSDAVTYLWSNGATTPEITQLSQGIYTVTVTTIDGCPSSQNITIYEPTVLSSNPTVTNETAFGANDGTLSANPTGGTAPFSYSWSNGSSAGTQNGLSPGDYSVTITDVNGCQVEENMTIAEFNCTTAANITSENITCFGENNGSATVNFTIGTAPFTYLWSNGATTATVSELSIGNYTVTATDANNCPSTFAIQITQPLLLQASVSTTGETAAGANDGIAIANPTGGTEPINYVWSNGESSQEITNLAPGNYSVTATDANGCQSIEIVTINGFNCALTAAISTEDITCFGENNGSAMVSIDGGAMPYTFDWSSGGDEQTETGLTVGDYTVTVTDAANCPVTLSFVITSPSDLSLNIIEQSLPICSDDTDGSIAVAGQGGTGNYTYAWSTGSTTELEMGLSVGVTTVTVTDTNNCTYEQEFFIEAQDTENPIASTQNATVFLNEMGQANISVTDVDNGSFDNCETVNLALSQTVFSCDDLGENEVSLFVNDNAGNESSAIANVIVVDEINPTISCPDNIAAGCNSFVEYTVPTATDNCSVNAVILTEGLGSGSNFPMGETIETYQAIDASGNTTTCSFTVTVSNPLTSIVEVEKPTCNGDTDGSASITVSGGTNLTYQWNDSQNQTTATAQNLSAGTYEVIVMDEEGCSITQTVVVPEPPALNISITEIVNDVDNIGIGGITAEVIGGEQPYTYTWTLDGEFYSNAVNLTDLFAGNYALQITDNNDCILLEENIVVELTSATNQPVAAQYFEIFPNPTSGKFFVQIGLPSSQNINLTLYDVAGRTIEMRDLERVREELVSFDLTKFANGVYELRAIVGEEVVVFKVVKM